MSNTYALVCHETRQGVWIGQGWDKMTSFYTAEPKTMETLKRFLNDHINKDLEFVCKDKRDIVFTYDRYE